jgi:hypothetical protein
MHRILHTVLFGVLNFHLFAPFLLVLRRESLLSIKLLQLLLNQCLRIVWVATRCTIFARLLLFIVPDGSAFVLLFG